MIKKTLLPLLIITALLLPLANGISFIGAINYIGPHGGIVTFNQNFQAASLTYTHGINYFTSMVWGPRLQGNLGFDADTNVNVTVTGITRDRISYTVTTAAPGNVNTYVYYYRNVGTTRLSEPDTVTVGGVAGTYTYTAGLLNVNSTGASVNVVLEWDDASVVPSLTADAGSLIGVFTLVTIVSVMMYIGGAKAGIDQELLMQIILVIAFLMLVGSLATGWGL